MAGVIENAKIESTTLGFEDHGCLWVALNLGGPGWGQSFPCLLLDEPAPEGSTWRRRATSPLGLNFVIRALEVLGRERWEDLPGTYCRVRRGDKYGTIVALGHFLEDKWIDIQELRNDHPELAAPAAGA